MEPSKCKEKCCVVYLLRSRDVGRKVASNVSWATCYEQHSRTWGSGSGKLRHATESSSPRTDIHEYLDLNNAHDI